MRLQDILTAGRRIVQNTSAMDYESFSKDEWTIDAVLRNLTVIGEATSRLPPDFVARHPEIPWDDMRDMRNLLVHEYFGVDPSIVWKTVRGDIPELMTALEGILSDASD